MGCGGPAVYWVVGNGTDVGKTTVATALIKVLSARGQRTIGFKPYAASLLHTIIDFMIEKYPKVPCKLFGNDAWELTAASPLTGLEIIDPDQPTVSSPLYLAETGRRAEMAQRIVKGLLAKAQEM